MYNGSVPEIRYAATLQSRPGFFCALFTTVICAAKFLQITRTLMRNLTVCDAWPVRVQTYSYRPNCMQNITDLWPVPNYNLLSDRGTWVWRTCPDSLRNRALWAYYNCDTSTIRVRFDYVSATTRYEMRTIRVRYNILRGVMCFRAIMNMSILSRCCRML